MIGWRIDTRGGSKHHSAPVDLLVPSEHVYEGPLSIPDVYDGHRRRHPEECLQETAK